MAERHRKLVVEEMLTKPSAVSPMIFVGLGGCGCRMVARVAQHLRRRADFNERYHSLVKFALVDTNVNDLESYRELADETFLLSDFEKEQYSNLASGKSFLEADQYFTQWVPPNYRFRSGDTAGAGQIRLEARLGVFYQMKHKNLVPRFRKLMEDLKSHEHGHRRLDTSEIRIIVCFSIAGGTGSGCHLPIAYMLRDQASELGTPWMVGVAVLPAVFEDKTGVNKDGTFANSYAALKEMEYLMKLGAPESRFYPEDGRVFHYDPSDESKTVVRQRPFELLYVVDKPESFSVPEPIDAAADGLYLQFFSPIFGAQVSDYDNYTQHQRFLVPHDFEAKRIPGFSTFYGSYGTAVLLVPVPGLVDYCSQASALWLMRASFLGAIPGDPIFSTLRLDPQRYNEVTFSDEKNQKPIAVKDLVKKTQEQQKKLRDRLYMKRVRLLAACEAAAGVEDRFLGIFRHGHRVGEMPSSQGGYELKEDRVAVDEEQRATSRMEFSIAAVVLPAITSEQEGERPGLLEHAELSIREYAERNKMMPADGLRLIDLKNRATGWMQDYQSVGMGVLLNGYVQGTLSYPGMDSLVELQFLNEDAGKVDLAAKRYAVLSILERTQGDWTPPPPTTDFDLPGEKNQTRPIKRDDQIPLIEELMRQAIRRAMETIERSFYEKLGEARKKLDNFVNIQRSLEQGFDEVERDRLRRLELLRQEGDTSANEYVLDAEGLQIEDGRRMWDFYYEDKIADLPELSMSDPNVQRVLSDTITSLSLSGSPVTTTILDQLYTALYEHARTFLHSYIGGDPHSPDRERRDGLTLSEALELEVVYRALYLSHTPEVEREGHKEIRQLVHEYRALPAEQKVDLNDPVHRDYLRDKIRRVIKEKASLLCVYEESRDQHGGVRPDEVFLAAIGQDFRNSAIEQAIRGTDIPRLTWVSEGWKNPKEIVFYRAMLNVPLYVFGRMNEMKDFYHRFKHLAKRPKALHIDRNWEDTLPDLDPMSAQNEHRQELVRNQIINFAVLFTLRPNGLSHGYILRRQGQYFLCDPALVSSNGNNPDSLTSLGMTMEQAIGNLPAALGSEKVKYMIFQQMLQAVREGLAPKVLSEIVLLPVNWRRNAEELRRLYRSRPGPLEQEMLDDYETSYRGLHHSLEDLLEELRRKQVQQKTLGEEVGGNVAGVDSDSALHSLSQSIAILESFSKQWKQMENPDESGSIPEAFKALFAPLEESDLESRLDRLRDAFGV
jgi:hypothetical protein